MAASEIYYCSMCTYETPKSTKLVNHMVRIHKNDPRFRLSCEIGNCGFSTRSWGSFKPHMSRKHKGENVIMNDDVVDNNADENDSSDDNDIESVAEERKFANSA